MRSRRRCSADLKLMQAEQSTWGRLQAEGSKQEITARRQACLARLHKLADEEREAKIRLKQQAERCISIIQFCKAVCLGCSGTSCVPSSTRAGMRVGPQN